MTSYYIMFKSHFCVTLIWVPTFVNLENKSRSTKNIVIIGIPSVFDHFYEMEPSYCHMNRGNREFAKAYTKANK